MWNIYKSILGHVYMWPVSEKPHICLYVQVCHSQETAVLRVRKQSFLKTSAKRKSLENSCFMVSRLDELQQVRSDDEHMFLLPLWRIEPWNNSLSFNRRTPVTSLSEVVSWLLPVCSVKKSHFSEQTELISFTEWSRGFSLQGESTDTKSNSNNCSRVPLSMFYVCYRCVLIKIPVLWRSSHQDQYELSLLSCPWARQRFVLAWHSRRP